MVVALQIRNVPEDARDLLAARAREQGQSLQGFLRGVILREASFANNIALIDSIGAWADGSGLTGDTILGALHDGRVEREAAVLASSSNVGLLEFFDVGD